MVAVLAWLCRFHVKTSREVTLGVVGSVTCVQVFGLLLLPENKIRNSLNIFDISFSFYVGYMYIFQLNCDNGKHRSYGGKVFFF